MADDDLEDDLAPEGDDEDLDEDAIDEELDGDDEDLADGDLVDDEAVVVDAVTEGDDDEAAEPAARAKKRRDEDEDDEDELDPDDVEADLDTILKDRIAAADEEEDEDELEVAPKAAEAPDGVIPKKANEFVCTGCFLLVNRGQFGPENDMQCPVGESECPAIDVLKGTGAKPAPAKASRKR